jgi:hypothetical protein
MQVGVVYHRDSPERPFSNIGLTEQAARHDEIGRMLSEKEFDRQDAKNAKPDSAARCPTDNFWDALERILTIGCPCRGNENSQKFVHGIILNC